MEHCYEIAKAVEKHWKGSGPLCVLLGLQVLAGISSFIVGNKGYGKTQLINAIVKNNSPKGYKVINFDQPTRTELVLNELGNTTGDYIENKRYFSIIRDMTTFGEINFECFYTVICSLIYDRVFTHTLGTVNNPWFMNFRNCKMIALVAITPEFYGKVLIHHPKFTSMASDRFFKICAINGLRDYTRDTVRELPQYDFRVRSNKEPKLLTDLSLVKRSFAGQVSDSRLNEYVIPLMKASASFEGYEAVGLKQEKEFRDLFWPYVELWGKLSFRSEFKEDSSELLFRRGMFDILDAISSWHSNEPLTLDALLSKLRYVVSNDNKRHVEERYIKPLKREGLIQEEKNSPTNYLLSKPLQDYWDMVGNL